MSRFVAVDRDTAYLLPPSVDEWLPENHLARFVVEVIDNLDLSELVSHYAGRGSDAQHPDHDTIATFRRRFLPQVKSLFVPVLRLALRGKEGRAPCGRCRLGGNGWLMWRHPSPMKISI